MAIIANQISVLIVIPLLNVVQVIKIRFLPNPNCPLECGVCSSSWKGASDESCSGGTFHPYPPDTSSEYKWTCRNEPHVANNTCAENSSDTDTRKASCNAPKPPIECGVCGVGSSECSGQGGPDKDSCCSQGEFHPNKPDTDTHWLWTCKNKPHVASDNCG